MNPKQIFQELSQKEQFDSIGFASANTLDIEMDNYKKWIDSAFHGDMGYLDRNLDKRANIGLILNNAKTVIVTLIHYAGFKEKYSNSPNSGKISKYAWSSDYHITVKEKLERIKEAAYEIWPSNSFKTYVDTGPILEKQWAIKAGLGWQGKNSLLLNKKLGSFCFIGIIITDLEIPSDHIQQDHCGKCTACIDACPTGAIVMPKVIDSRKCISYWTIETKSDKKFPSEISTNLNSWLFGCDICQDVCPWNKKVKIEIKDEFLPINNQIELKLDEVKEMTQEKFSVRFKNTPIKRSKLAGLIRNASELSQT